MKKRTGPAKAKSSRRSYTAPERTAALAALAANGGRLAQTAQQLGMPRKTLERWVIGIPTPTPSTPLAPQVAPQKKGVAQKAQETLPLACALLADKLDGLAHKLVDAMPDKIDKASLQQCAVAAGVAIEKSRLLREQSTANVAGSVRVAFIEVPADVSAEASDRQTA